MKGAFVGVMLFLGFAVLPSFAAAQSLPPLVPCNGPECQACHVVELAQRIINFLIVVATLIAVGMFAYAGLLMVTNNGDSGQVSKAKGIFTTVAIGFIILLAGWLIIDTVMKMLYEGSALDQSTRSSFGPWNQIECVVINPSATTWTSTTTPGAGIGTVDADELTHEQATALLQGTGINVVSTGSCSDPSISTCTALVGMREDTLRQAIAIKTACPTCEVTITGGTETGHSTGGVSHSTGYKIDINDTSSVDSFLTSSLTRSGSRSGDPRYVDSCGNEYVRESDHWDIAVTNGTCSF